MLIFDFFAGTGSSTLAFEQAGDTVIKVELDEQFEAHERNVLSLTADYLLNTYGQPHFIWASPPCTTFSVASIGRHWDKHKQPKTQQAQLGLALVMKTIELIQQLKPSIGYLIENPRGMLRKQTIMAMPRHTVTYCQYGDKRMKPTDLFGQLPTWQPKPTCKSGDSCHEAAPRGSRTGTQGIKGSKLRSMIPYELSQSICDAVHKAHDTPKEYA